MPVAVGFTVACSSGTAPGEDAIGDFTFRVSLNYGGDTIYVDIPVHGKKDSKDKENGNDTKDVAENAATAVTNNEGLSKAQKDKIKVQEDQGGPGNTLGRIVIDDPTLKSVDAACDDKGKLQIQIISWGASSAGDGIKLGESSPGKRRWRTARKGAEPTEPPKRPGTGNTYQRFLDPGRTWRTIQGMVLVGIEGPTGAIGNPFELPYVDGLTGAFPVWALVGFDVIGGSPVEQLAEVEQRLISAGFSCRQAGGTLFVTGVVGRPDVIICGLGITFATVPNAPGNAWETAIRVNDHGEFGLDLRPSSLEVGPIPAAWFGGKARLCMPDVRDMPTSPGGVLVTNPALDRVMKPIAAPAGGSLPASGQPADGDAVTSVRRLEFD